MEWTLQNNQPNLAFLAGKPFYYWRPRANYREPLNWLERALVIQADISANERAHALNNTGSLAENLGDMASAKKYFEAALTIFRKVNDQAGIAGVLNDLGGVAESEDNYENAHRLYEESLSLKEPVSFTASMTLLNLGRVARKRGDWEQSHTCFLRARGICEQLGMETGISYADYFLGVLALAQGKLDEAQTYIETSKKASWLQQSPLFSGIIEGLMGYILLRKNQVEQARPLLSLGLQSVAGFLNQGTDPWADVQITEGKARLELIDNRLERAAQLFGISWSARLSDEFPLTEFERPDYEACINIIRARLGDEVFNVLFEKGKAMPLKDAIAFALEETQ
jgi:Tfp pilus assembly protein PilF